MPKISEVTAALRKYYRVREIYYSQSIIRSPTPFYRQYSEFVLHKVPVLHKPEIRVKQHAHIRGGNLHTAAAIRRL